MDQIEEIRSKIDLVAFISETLPLKKAGRNFKALCPFHAEKTPSFMVSPERQIWHCFGCQKGGDVFGYLMETERIEFGEALRILAKKAGVTLQSYRPTRSETEKDKLYQINHLASEFFHYLLLNHRVGERALNYVLQRGITKESLELFKIGYSPPMWDGLQRFLIGKKGYAVEDLEKAGLVIQGNTQNAPQLNKFVTGQAIRNTFYDRFRDRLMFPLSDHRGNVTGFAGRVLDPAIKEAKYVNTPETLVYHKSELLYPLQITKEKIKKENSAVVVEGELDAISSFQVGVGNVVAIKGSALTEEQARLLKRFTENLILSLDSDTAGDMAARRGIEVADKAGFNIKIVVLEKYKDPDEAAQKEPGYLKEQIKNAENIYDFFINSAFKRFRGQTAEEKKKIGQELIPVLSKIEDEIVKNVFVKKLARRLGVNEESIILQIEKVSSKTLPMAKKMSDQEETKSGRDILEGYYLALIFQSKRTDILLEGEEILFKSTACLKLIKYLKKYSEENKKFSSQFFFKSLPAELKETFDRLYIVDFGEKIDDENWVVKELKKARNRLEGVGIKEELQAALSGLRERKDEEDGANLRQKICLLTQKLSKLGKVL